MQELKDFLKSLHKSEAVALLAAKEKYHELSLDEVATQRTWYEEKANLPLSMPNEWVLVRLYAGPMRQSRDFFHKVKTLHKWLNIL